MSQAGRHPNCIDIVEPYIAAVAAEGMPPVQLLGGVGSVALAHANTIIDTSSTGLIVAPSDLYLPQFRPEGTKRDIETLVLSADPADAARVQECAEQQIGEQLIVETFGVKDIARVNDQAANPFGIAAMTTFVSDRYADPALGSDAPMLKSLFPFAASIDPKLLQAWSLRVEGRDMTIPVPPVGTVVLNYLTRSISGARPKDAEKLEAMATAIFDKAPDTVGWIVDGPGREQFELARVLHTLRESKRHPRTLTVGGKLGVTAMPYDKLREHPSFLLREASTKTQARALAWARFKSRTLHAGETHLGFLVGPWQTYVEPRLGKILHNDAGSKTA